VRHKMANLTSPLLETVSMDTEQGRTYPESIAIQTADRGSRNQGFDISFLILTSQSNIKE